MITSSSSDSLSDLSSKDSFSVLGLLPPSLKFALLRGHGLVALLLLPSAESHLGFDLKTRALISHGQETARQQQQQVSGEHHHQRANQGILLSGSRLLFWQREEQLSSVKEDVEASLAAAAAVIRLALLLMSSRVTSS